MLWLPHHSDAVVFASAALLDTAVESSRADWSQVNLLGGEGGVSHDVPNQSRLVNLTSSPKKLFAASSPLLKRLPRQVRERSCYAYILRSGYE